MKVLMVAPPYAGHLNPLLVIAGHLAGRGAVCRFVTGPAKAPYCHELGFGATAVLAGDPDAMERIADTGRRMTGHPLRALRQVSANLRLLPRALPDVQVAAECFGPDVIVADFCAPVAGVVAERLGVPWVTTIPTPFAIEGRRGTPAYCGGWRPVHTPLGTLRDAVGRQTTRTMKRLAGRLFARELAVFGGSLYRSDGTEVFYSDQAIVALGLAELEFERDWPPTLRFVGPLTASPGEPFSVEPVAPRVVEPVEAPPDSNLDTLDPRRPRVLVTVGTHLPWVKRGLVARVVALAERLPGFDFAVALGDAGGTVTPSRVAASVAVVGWLDYDVALRGFDVVIHHGGAGITYSTLRAGVPAVVWPQDYDQFDFAARLVHQGLGVRIRRLDEAAAALPRALALPRPAQDRFERLVRTADPLAAVDRVLDEVVGG